MGAAGRQQFPGVKVAHGDQGTANIVAQKLAIASDHADRELRRNAGHEVRLHHREHLVAGRTPQSSTSSQSPTCFFLIRVHLCSSVANTVFAGKKANWPQMNTDEHG
jgi:hypothetical protein